MAETRQYDAIIIGSGQGGGPLSTALVAAGRKTALIERQYVGGTCINYGCTPTKTMVASAREAYLARRSSDYGVHDGPVSVDMVEVRQRKRDLVETFRAGSEQAIRAGKVDLLFGEASFTGPHSLQVRMNSGELLELTADTIVIDTGTSPSTPPIEGLKDVPSLNSTTIMELDRVPEHLLILGGGYIGLEFGQMFRRFGSRVTIVQDLAQLLGREDQDIAEAVADILREDGIEILLKSKVTRVEQGDGRIKLSVEMEGGTREVEGSHLLVAAGRAPNTEPLQLDAAGVQSDQRGYIQVNDRLETNVPGIWAIGEVAGTPPFTHMAYDDFRILRDNLLHHGNRTKEGRLVPYTVFIDPQLGRVGLSEDQARKQGRKIKVAKMPMSSVARAIETDETRGIMKAVVDAESGEILGCTVLGMEGGEIMAMFEIAMMGKLTYERLHEGIFAHPTLAESVNSLFSHFEGEG